jgi:hypothetical protein
MKKITFLVASIFIIGGGVANAAEKTNFSHERRAAVDFRNADPIMFTERGIEFLVFPDGQFDFNTRPSANNDRYYKSNRRSSVNSTYGAPAISRNDNYAVKVEHDNFGRVRRIGNVFINYDANDRIKRVGSVYMSYNRFALEQIGGMQIIYNRRGQIVDFIGSVKGRSATVYNQNNCENSNQDYEDHQDSNDENQFYYKTNTTKTKAEDTKLTGSLDIRINKK